MTGMSAKRVTEDYCAQARMRTLPSLIRNALSTGPRLMPTQYPAGIQYVIVNGQISVVRGERTAVLAGRPIRGPGFKK